MRRNTFRFLIKDFCLNAYFGCTIHIWKLNQYIQRRLIFWWIFQIQKLKYLRLIVKKIGISSYSLKNSLSDGLLFCKDTISAILYCLDYYLIQSGWYAIIDCKILSLFVMRYYYFCWISDYPIVQFYPIRIFYHNFKRSIIQIYSYIECSYTMKRV